MNREEALREIRARAAPWDIAVIGGGATGVGVVLDAASRGYEAVLLERGDFGQGTSSRSTKLIHGGVRYLRQGNVRLVMGALRERAILRRNASHVVRELEFVLPVYRWWEGPFYWTGLKLYDLLAGRRGFGRSRWLSKGETLERVQTLKPDGLRGGVCYHDGQFDDARLLVSMARAAAEWGATLVNYAGVTGLMRDGHGRVAGVAAREAETGEELRIAARVTVNATGPFCDEVRRMADPGARPMIAPSRGAHVVLAKSFLPGDAAIIVPRTSDGRVMFAIPWHGHVVVGTTDTAVPVPEVEPRASEEEIGFILETVGRYLARPVRREDVLSTFAGIRPLVGGVGAVGAVAPGGKTSALSRDHTIEVTAPGLVTITGGKWTTYRTMAEECVGRAAEVAGLERRACVTRDMALCDADAGVRGHLSVYGADARAIAALAEEDAELARPLHAALPYTGAEVVWAVRREMARTVEDVLARRTRALFLDARAALEMAPRVARIMAGELGKGEEWEREEVDGFSRLARSYLVDAG